jgi:hypothetical protein
MIGFGFCHLNKDEHLHFQVPVPEYTTPEVFEALRGKTQRINPKADIYLFGMLIKFLISINNRPSSK